MESKSDQASALTNERASAAAISMAGLLALTSASCCVLAIGLSILGVGGSWLALLGPLVANRTSVLIGAGLLIGIAWLRVLSRWRCNKGRRASLFATAGASMLFALAVSAPLREQSATRYMLVHWILPR